MRTALAVLALVPALTVPQPAVAAACVWQTTTLSVPAGGSSTAVDGTDHSGGFAGTAYISGDRRHVLFWKNGTITDYGGVASASASVSVVDQNRAGTILGHTSDGFFGAIKTAFRIRSGQWEQLAFLPGSTAPSTHPVVSAINDAGVVVGTNQVQRNGQSGSVVVRWAAGSLTPVEVPGVPFNSAALDIDEDGTILVGVRDSTQALIPHVLRGGVLTALPAPGNTRNPRAAAISNGRVTGHASLNSGRLIGVYWDQANVPRTLPGSIAGLLINRDGLIVGQHEHPDLSHGVWRLTTLEHTFGTFDDHAYTGTISDDGTFAGQNRGVPTVWRCG